MTAVDNETQRFSYIDSNMAEGINKANGTKENKSRTLHVPDLFEGILAGDPVENPLESTIGLASEEWTKALAAPKADLFAFRMAVDWCIWAFVFDDQSAHEIIWTLSLMDDTHPPVDPKTQPLRYMFQSIWHRFQEIFSTVGKNPIGSACSYCLFVVVEWAYGIKLTQDIFDHPSVSTCERAAADLTWLVNDVLSYKKDLASGVEHNIICLLMRKGYSEQEAMDKTGDMMKECHKDWDIAVANLPSWGEQTDKEVQRYLCVARDSARANLWWSFRSGRYLDAAEAAQVQANKTLTLEN
ncbi:hypothetical protein FHL15_006667 [Xylaria flabelliformis]|uniref:Terpene synthase n=1 Tax=Xylaria flabelliformis TaxID=2512241 RepID=A0A553HX15_9PEZI|nr:hypothetical protein FHL15_006667 [Xylaria flabelliformis]